MKIATIKTGKITPKKADLFKFLDQYAPKLEEKSIVVITSKIVSILEGSFVPLDSIDKDDLVRREADLYYFHTLPSGYVQQFTIVNETFIKSAGVDESNADGNYILWPKHPMETASKITKYLKKRDKLKNLGVLITDSKIMPSRFGTIGIAIAFCGFAPYLDYRGSEDLFGRVMKGSVSNIAGGLAAAAVNEMGEGAEATPIAIITDAKNVKFVSRSPSEKEIKTYFLSPLEDNVFSPFFSKVKWQKGHR